MTVLLDQIACARGVPVDRNPDACVVVPALNEAPVIEGVIAALFSAFKNVVCVDDGSVDGSGTLAGTSGAQVVRHPRNLGQGAALQTGIDYALRLWCDARYIVTFDSDGQHRVEDAIHMLEVARESGVGIVLGSRFSRPAGNVPLRRRTLLKAGLVYTRATTRLRLTDTHCGLRVLRRDVAEGLHLRQNGMAHASELLQVIARQRITYTEVPVDVRYSAYSLDKGQHAVNGINILVDLALDRLRDAR